MIAENKFGYDEIVDTVSDMAKAEVKAYDTFKGKFDLARALTWAIGEYATIKEAYEDFETFEAQIKDLFADEGMEAIAAIGSKLTEDEKGRSRLYKIALFAAFGYKNTTTVIELGEQQLALGRSIFEK
jgi:hypothetical protein